MRKAASLKPRENVIKKIVRDVVREEMVPVEKRITDELDTKLETFQENIIEAIGKKNDSLRSDIATMKDEIVGELKKVREEQTVLNGKSEKVNDLETRIEVLEALHPEGQHST